MHEHSSPWGQAGREEVSLPADPCGEVSTTVQCSTRQRWGDAGCCMERTTTPWLHQRWVKGLTITSPRNCQVTGHGLRVDLCLQDLPFRIIMRPCRVHSSLPACYNLREEVWLWCLFCFNARKLYSPMCFDNALIKTEWIICSEHLSRLTYFWITACGSWVPLLDYCSKSTGHFFWYHPLWFQNQFLVCWCSVEERH